MYIAPLLSEINMSKNGHDLLHDMKINLLSKQQDTKSILELSIEQTFNS